MKPDSILRRAKSSPAADMWHTLRIGAAAFLLLILPGLLFVEWQLTPTPETMLRDWLQEQLAAIQERTNR